MVVRNKNLASAVLSLAILVSSVAGVSVVAAESASAAAAGQVQLQAVNVTINGTVQTFDQPAILHTGSTMVPMRGVFEALDATINWDNATRTVTATKGDTTIVLTIGNAYAHVNGSKVVLTKEALIVNGSTMVPLRFVAEALGAKVDWNANTQTAIIQSAGGSSTIGTSTGVTAPSVGTSQYAGLKIHHGTHTYASANQNEYDTVYQIAKDSLATIDRIDLRSEFGVELSDYLLNGVRVTYEGRSKNAYDMTIRGWEDQLSVFTNNNISTNTIFEVLKVGKLISNEIGTTDNLKVVSSTKSAYHALVQDLIDCDSSA
jgi:hypothetical protein